MKIAVAQMTSVDDVAENMKFVLKSIGEAAKGGARLIAFPENSLYLRLAPGAEIEEFDLGGPEAKAIREGVNQHGIHVLLTTPTTGRDGKSLNSVIWFQPGAEPRIVYSKIHMFDVDVDGAPSVRESDKFLSGAGPAVIEIEGWRIGLTICYDLRFAELFLQYAHKVDLILVPSAFLVPTGEAHWHVLLRARAIEGQCFVVAPAQGGEHHSMRAQVVRKTYGHSLVVDPWGQVIYDHAGAAGIKVIELDRSRLDWVRKQIPMVRHRRMLKASH